MTQGPRRTFDGEPLSFPRAVPLIFTIGPGGHIRVSLTRDPENPAHQRVTLEFCGKEPDGTFSTRTGVYIPVGRCAYLVGSAILALGATALDDSDPGGTNVS